MGETKNIDPAALATITTGITMTDFSMVHEAMEWVMGHPVWTHQIPDLMPKMAEAVLTQFPDMPRAIENGEWEWCRDEVRARYGATVPVSKGPGGPHHPLDYLPEKFRG